jgi:hypothetical protein
VGEALKQYAGYIRCFLAKCCVDISCLLEGDVGAERKDTRVIQKRCVAARARDIDSVQNSGASMRQHATTTVSHA